MRRFLFVCWASVGCTVQQYGGGPTDAVEVAVQTASAVDFSAVESRIEDMIADETENLDRRDRLEAAWELCQKAKTARPEAQQVIARYLERIADIEARFSDAETDAIANPDEQTFVPIASIVAERLEPPAAAQASADRQRLRIVPPDSGAADVMSSARAYLAIGDVDSALKQLQVCIGQPCGAATVTLLNEVKDRLVYREREAAGERFNRAKSEPDRQQRIREIRAVAASLRTLAAKYPESRYVDGVRASLRTVQAVLSEETKGGVR